MNRIAGKVFLRRALAAVLLLFIAVGASWAGQKKTKKKASPDADSSLQNATRLPPSDQVEHDIGEMLGAWQIGDVEMLHKHYADNSTFVSGAYEPPIVGWPNYLVAYQRQRQRIQGMQFIRRNTNVFLKGDVAWASYQWEFDATVDGKPSSARGQTTLVFLHAGDRWLIVHNHTSEICEAPPAPPPAETGPASPQPPGH